MKRKNLFGKVTACLLACAMIFPITGCTEKEKESSNGIIAVITKSQQSQYWEGLKLGALDAGEELGYTIRYNAPPNEDHIEDQIKYVNDAVSEGAKAIVIAPIDSKNQDLLDAVKNADEQGIIIISADTNLNYDGQKTYIGTKNTSASAIAGRKYLNLLDENDTETIEVGVIGHAKNNALTNERINGFESTLTNFTSGNSEAGATGRKYSIEIVARKYCEVNRETAKQQAADIISGHEEKLKLIYGTNEESTLGICSAIEELGMAGKIKAIGFDTSDEELNYIRNGILYGTVVQNPYNMGYFGVRYAKKAINGEYIPSTIDTGVTFVTAENIDDEDVQLIINPAKFE